MKHRLVRQTPTLTTFLSHSREKDIDLEGCKRAVRVFDTGLSLYDPAIPVYIHKPMTLYNIPEIMIRGQENN